MQTNSPLISNDSKLFMYQAALPIDSSLLVVKIENGRLVLPNGQTYKVTKLKIKGIEINLEKDPLTNEQVKAIQKFANDLFQKLSDTQRSNLNLNQTNLKSVTFKTESNHSASIITTQEDKSFKQEDIATDILSMPKIIQELHQAFLPNTFQKFVAKDNLDPQVAEEIDSENLTDSSSINNENSEIESAEEITLTKNSPTIDLPLREKNEEEYSLPVDIPILPMGTRKSSWFRMTELKKLSEKGKQAAFEIIQGKRINVKPCNLTSFQTDEVIIAPKQFVADFHRTTKFSINNLSFEFM